MQLPNWSKVRLILQRELRDQVRDRRTLFMVAVLPLLLYPLLGIGLFQVSQFLKKHPSKVLLIAPTNQSISDTAREASEMGQIEAKLAERQHELLDIEVRSEREVPKDETDSWASQLIAQRFYDAVAFLPADPDGSNAHVAVMPPRSTDDEEKDHGGPTVEERPARPRIYFDAAKDRSQIAYQRLTPILESWTDSDFSHRQLAQSDERSATISATDVSCAVRRRAAIWSKILPFVVFVWALTGAFYPAVDLCAGEKERGTLETLLSSAAERLDVVWAKLLTTMVFSAVTALLNMVCMFMTAFFVFQQFASLADSPSMMPVGLPPWSALVWITIALIPITALFGSLALALASMARSTKEGQYYLLPLLMGFMPLMMLSIFPAARLDLGTSLLPVTGIMLCLRHLMEGEHSLVWTYILPVLAVTCTCCTLAIRWAVDQFNNEDVLFRSGERFSISLWLGQLVRDRAATPTMVQALLCGMVILFIRFFAGGAIGFPNSWNEFVVYTAATLLGFVAAPALLMTAVLTNSPQQTLLLKRPMWTSVFAAVGLAICLHPVATALLVLVRQCYPVDSAALAPLQELLGSAPSIWSLVAVMALLPAVCEELAFRGFILSGLRQSGRKWRAIFISSLLFALAHGVLQQSLIAGVFGVVLAYIAIQSDSLLPCIAFHATHNTMGILSADWLPRCGATWPESNWLVHTLYDAQGAAEFYVYGTGILVFGLLTASLLLVWFARHALPDGLRGRSVAPV